MKLVRGSALVVASHNTGKVREIFDLLKPYGIAVRGAAELGLAEPEETGKTFAENAVLKARAAAVVSKLPAIADDSGLVVPALDGSPGIYSARWAGPDRDFKLAMAKVERLFAELKLTDRTAKFVCALAYCEPSGNAQVFEGEVHGQLVFPPRGNKGFGYDPLFVPKGYTETFGELDPPVKHGISHRARAFEKFSKALIW
jgi:XTP/dITP diphosphohydrolase